MGGGMGRMPYSPSVAREKLVTRASRCCGADLHVIWQEGYQDWGVEWVDDLMVPWRNPNSHPAVWNKRNLAMTIRRWMHEFPDKTVCLRHAHPKLPELVKQANPEEWIVPVKRFILFPRPFLEEVRWMRYAVPAPARPTDTPSSPASV